MNILHCIYDHINNPWVGGGGAVRVREIYRLLARRHRVTVVCGNYPGADDYAEENVNFHFAGRSKNNYVISTFSYALRAAQFLKRFAGEADVIIEDFAPYNPLFSMFLVNKPVILQVHHKEGINLFKRYFVLGIPFMAVESFYPKFFKNIISVSSWSSRKFNIKNSIIIPNGINDQLFKVSLPEKDYLAYIGRVHMHNKGLDTLVAAMRQINVRLLIAGKGRDAVRLQSLVKKCGLSNTVSLTGHISEENKGEFLAGAKIVIVPSRYEGQGIVILEAAACGKPVIVSNLPELQYAVDAGFALAFKTGDARDLAGKIQYLLDNEAIRQGMGLKAKEYARKFSWEKVASEYENYLIQVHQRHHE
jgi:glycogen synthase